MTAFFLIVLAFAVLVLWSRQREDRRALQEQVHLLQGQLAALAAAPAAHAAPAAAAPAPATVPLEADPAPAASSFADLESGPAPSTLTMPPSEPRERSTFERLVAEHALSIVGGVFVLVAAVLFVTFAIDQGWIGARTRFGLALAFGLALVAAAVRVASSVPEQERRGRAIGSLHGVLAGTGVGVLFLAIVAAVQLQELFSPLVGVVLEAFAACIAVALAVRWKSQDLAAFGIGVALAAPMLVEAPASNATVAVLSVALLGAAVVAVSERWPRLLLVAALVTAPQVGAYGEDASIAAAVGVSSVWWFVLVGAAMAASLRRDAWATRSAISAVLVSSAAAVAIAWSAFDGSSSEPQWWAYLAAFAAAHLLLGVALLRVRPPRGRVEPLAIAMIGVGASLAMWAVGDGWAGAAVVAGWAVEAVALAALWWSTRNRLTGLIAVAIGACAIALTLGDVAGPWLLVERSAALLQPVLAVLAVGVAALVTRLLLTRRAPQTAITDARDWSRVDATCVRALDLLAYGAAWYIGGITIAHVLGEVDVANVATADRALAAWVAAGAMLLVVLGARLDRNEWIPVVGLAGVAEASLLFGASHALEPALWVLVPTVATAVVLGRLPAVIRSAPASAGLLLLGWWQVLLLLVVVLDRVPISTLRTYDAGDRVEAIALVAVLALAVAAMGMATRSWREAPHRVRRPADVSMAVAALYVVSIAVVALASPVAGRFEQSAQVALTFTWVALGVVALGIGTSRRFRRHGIVRAFGYALLALGAGKLVIADTADLETPLRVLAFLVTGLALLGSAALEQRLRASAEREP